MTGVPTWAIASAIAKSSDPKHIKYIIDKYEADRRTNESMSGKKPGEDF